MKRKLLISTLTTVFMATTLAGCKPAPATLKSIRIAAEPKVTEYAYEYEGPVSLEGLVVEALYSDETTKEITDYQHSSLTPTVGEKRSGKFTVTIIYQNKGAEINYTFKTDYTERKVEVYSSVDTNNKPVSEKQVSLRFYNNLPNIPYISVSNYFKEFFKTTFQVDKEGDAYKYSIDNGDYICFDSKFETFTSLGLYSFNKHPDYKSSTGKLFIKNDTTERTTRKARTVALSNYEIDIRDDGNDAYVPLTFLSKLAGGFDGYNVQYNMKDIYIIDQNGSLGTSRTASTYSSYYEVWDDEEFVRPTDLAKYTYGELCFVFDNLRGYTSQLTFGDNNLLSLGLNGLLEHYYPNLKTLLLSSEKEKYYQGITALFFGLNDGGHTAMVGSPAGARDPSISQAIQSNPELAPLAAAYSQMLIGKMGDQAAFTMSKVLAFNWTTEQYRNHTNYYIKDDTTKTAYIGFDKFYVNYDAWNEYYTNQGELPGDDDSYSFMIRSFEQAKADGIENLVIDLTTNGGGNDVALNGIVGILNGGKSNFNMNDTFNQSRITDKYSIDINLDGKFNNDDVAKANEYKNQFKIGILTSRYSFSCGNLLPSMLKELGYKTIGERTGGGSCAIIMESTADGISYGHSSYRCLSDASGHNIDDGVPVDLTIERGPMDMEHQLYFDVRAYYDIAAVGTWLSTAYNS